MAERPVKAWIERLWRIFGDGVDALGAYVPSRRALRVIPDNESLFGEQITAVRRTTVAYNSAYGLTKLRLRDTTTGSASIVDTNPGKITLATGATAGSRATLKLSEVGIYAPGHDAEVGIGVRPRQALAGTAFAKWGGRSSGGSDGFYFKLTANGINAVRLKDGVEEDVVAISEWNIDRFDGSEGRFNPSKINLDVDNGYIYQVDFTWYGFGIILFGIVRGIPDAPEKQRFIPGHVLQVTGDISIQEPNLQVFIEIDNGDQTTDYAIGTGGMQYAVLGEDEGGRERKVDEYVQNVSVTTALTHLMTFRRDSARINRSLKTNNLNLRGSGERIAFELWIGGEVTLGSGDAYATPTNYTDSETTVEVVKEQEFDETDAVLIDRFFVEAGSGNQSGESREPLVDVDLPDAEILTLTARVTTGTTGTVSLAQVKLLEGW